MSRPRFSLRTLLIVVAVFAGMCALCAGIFKLLPNDVTQAELNQLTVGMTKDEVRSILGEPDRVYNNSSWGYGFIGVIVEFDENDRFVQAYPF